MTKITERKSYLMAIGGFFVAGLGALAVAAVDNSITLGEGVASLATAAAAAGAVYGIKNGGTP